METFTLSLFSADPNPKYNKDVLDTVAIPWSAIATTIISKNWSPAVFSNRARSLSNYRGAPSLFAFDIDEGMTLAQAVNAFKDFRCLIGTSRNHQKVKHPGQTSERPACDRFRVVFALSEPITCEDDFKATWSAYKDQYPLDKQTNNAAGFFFKCTEIIFENPTGKPLPVIKHTEWQDLKSDIYQFVKDDKNPQRGCLSQRTKEFLSSGAKPGMFNLSLFKAAVDHLEQRYPEAEFMERLHAMIITRTIEPLDDADLSTIRSAYNREPKYGARISGRSSIDAQKHDIATRIMDGEFIQVILPKQTLWYQIRDYENKEVELIQNEQILERHIAEQSIKPENHYNTTKKIGSEMIACTKSMEVKEVLEIWRLRGTALHQLPEPILWRGVDHWCHKRFNFDLVPGQPHPNWDEFIQRLSEPEIFKAWLFACFVPEHETRQALWLHGKSGEDGKTKVINVIGKQFGDALASLDDGQIKADSRFFLSQFLGKRMAIYPDCLEVNFPQTGKFRNLTGSDTVTMEMKGGGFMHQPLKTKVLIGSNFEPKMTGANYDKSRMLVIDVAPNPKRDDKDWPRRLELELPAFLGDCQGAYKSLCPNHGKIDVSERMNSRLEDISDQSQEELQMIFDEFFELTQERDRFVGAHQMFNMVDRRTARDYDRNLLLGRMKNFLEIKFGVLKRRDTNQKWFFEGLAFRSGEQGKMFDTSAK